VFMVLWGICCLGVILCALIHQADVVLFFRSFTTKEIQYKLTEGIFMLPLIWYLVYLIRKKQHIILKVLIILLLIVVFMINSVILLFIQLSNLPENYRIYTYSDHEIVLSCGAEGAGVYEMSGLYTMKKIGYFSVGDAYSPDRISFTCNVDYFEIHYFSITKMYKYIDKSI